jgi:hypothetical protein
LAIYSKAVDTFVQTATAFMEHLKEAREAYEEAMRASVALRDSLDWRPNLADPSGSAGQTGQQPFGGPYPRQRQTGIAER